MCSLLPNGMNIGFSNLKQVSSSILQITPCTSFFPRRITQLLPPPLPKQHPHPPDPQSPILLPLPLCPFYSSSLSISQFNISVPPSFLIKLHHLHPLSPQPRPWLPSLPFSLPSTHLSLNPSLHLSLDSTCLTLTSHLF